MIARYAIGALAITSTALLLWGLWLRGDAERATAERDQALANYEVAKKAAADNALAVSQMATELAAITAALDEAARNKQQIRVVERERIKIVREMGDCAAAAMPADVCRLLGAAAGCDGKGGAADSDPGKPAG